MVLTHAAGRNGRIGGSQPREHGGFGCASCQPEDFSRAVDDWISQRHPPPTLIFSRDCHIAIRHFENRIAGNERCGVTVGAETQMNQIEDRRSASQGGERLAQYSFAAADRSVASTGMA